MNNKIKMSLKVLLSIGSFIITTISFIFICYIYYGK